MGKMANFVSFSPPCHVAYAVEAQQGQEQDQ